MGHPWHVGRKGRRNHSCARSIVRHGNLAKGIVGQLQGVGKFSREKWWTEAVEAEGLWDWDGFLGKQYTGAEVGNWTGCWGLFADVKIFG